VSAPLNPAYSADEVSFYLKDTGASILLVGPSATSSDNTAVAGKQCGVAVYAVHLELDADAGEVKAVRLREVVPAGRNRVHVQVSNEDQAQGGDVKPQDVALVLHTSGTTGRPKGVWSLFLYPPLFPLPIFFFFWWLITTPLITPQASR
jgi:long-subunit acyl-CoA synthetase (AMP-forming)